MLQSILSQVNVSNMNKPARVQRETWFTQSDLSQNFEVDDISTGKDAISGLKSSPWAGLDKLVNTSLVQILEYDITTN
jgi:hypothetical protein